MFPLARQQCGVSCTAHPGTAGLSHLVIVLVRVWGLVSVDFGPRCSNVLRFLLPLLQALCRAVSQPGCPPQGGPFISIFNVCTVHTWCQAAGLQRIGEGQLV